MKRASRSIAKTGLFSRSVFVVFSRAFLEGFLVVPRWSPGCFLRLLGSVLAPFGEHFPDLLAPWRRGESSAFAAEGARSRGSDGGQNSDFFEASFDACSGSLFRETFGRKGCPLAPTWFPKASKWEPRWSPKTSIKAPRAETRLFLAPGGFRDPKMEHFGRPGHHF